MEKSRVLASKSSAPADRHRSRARKRKFFRKKLFKRERISDMEIGKDIAHHTPVISIMIIQQGVGESNAGIEGN